MGKLSDAFTNMDKNHEKKQENTSSAELKLQRGSMLKDDGQKKTDMKAFVEKFLATQKKLRNLSKEKKAATAAKTVSD